MTSTEELTDITILSFVSGKGGVGKTMLAIATAHELSQGKGTLILDLDFFNRGLSGLLRNCDEVMAIPRPVFVSDDDGSPKWMVREVANQLYTVSFPDLSDADFRRCESLPIRDLADALREWIKDLCSKLRCRSVVLDCHGGPDRVSFAVALISRCCLLISEPDRITMHGTLHFLRMFERALPESGEIRPNANVYLVFNKVVDAFSAWNLRRTYDLHLRDCFDDKRLLAVFPLEVHLMKFFEHHPLTTEYFPTSMLARKTAIMLADLLGADAPELLSARSRGIPWLLAVLWRNTFGRTPRLLTVNFVIVLNFIAFVGFFVFVAILDVEDKNELELAVKIGLPVALIFPLWASFAVLLSWSKYLNLRLTLWSRRMKRFLAVWYAVILIFVWAFMVGTLFGLNIFFDALNDVMAQTENGAEMELFALSHLGLRFAKISVELALYVGILFVTSFALGQMYESYCDLRYTRFRLSGFLRIICGVTVCVLTGLVLLSGISFVVWPEMGEWLEGIRSRLPDFGRSGMP